MAAPARSARSSAAPSRHATRGQSAPTRPQLHVVRGGADKARQEHERGTDLLQWAKGRTVSVVNMVIAVAFLCFSLFGSLVLRTQMEQNSFSQSQARDNISKLSQDVQDDQAQLDRLEASLPDKAQQMGMVPQQGSISVDLSGAAQAAAPADGTQGEGQQPQQAPQPAQDAGNGGQSGQGDAQQAGKAR